ncbi:unnamed protein product, partial [Natator depressus]
LTGAHSSTVRRLTGLAHSSTVRPAPFSDHHLVTVTVSLRAEGPGPAYWHFNNSLLEDESFVISFRERLTGLVLREPELRLVLSAYADDVLLVSSGLAVGGWRQVDSG